MNIKIFCRCSLFPSCVGLRTCQHPCKKLTGFKLVKKFPAFHGTRRFITAFISARHLSLSWAISIQSIPQHPTSWRSILILFSHLRLGLPSGLFPPGFHTNTLYTPLLSPIRVTCSAHLILLDFITRIMIILMTIISWDVCCCVGTIY